MLAISNLMCLVSAYGVDMESFTKTKPKTEEMAGKYLPTKETLVLVKETGKYILQDISIELYPNGTFEMKNMPDWWITNHGESNNGSDSGTGKWTLSSHAGKWWDIEFEFVEGGTFSSRNELSGGFYTTKEISGESPPYSLWFYIGDPDKGRVMIFEQVIETP